MGKAIEIKNLSKTYLERENDLQYVINGLNLSIETGQLVGLIGRAGAGKSTLLRLIAGLDEPNSGSIEIRNMHQFGGGKPYSTNPPDTAAGIGSGSGIIAGVTHYTHRQRIV